MEGEGREGGKVASWLFGGMDAPASTIRKFVTAVSMQTIV